MRKKRNGHRCAAYLTRVVSARVDAGLYSHLRAEAAGRGCSLSDHVRDLLQKEKYNAETAEQ